MIIRERGSWRVTDMEIHRKLGTDRAANPEQSYSQREIENILASEIRALRTAIRTAIEMQQLQELSTRETAVRESRLPPRNHGCFMEERHSEGRCDCETIGSK
jgi:DNA-directed RNA polymerase specialized sigma24 family protein